MIKKPKLFLIIASSLAVLAMATVLVVVKFNLSLKSSEKNNLDQEQSYLAKVTSQDTEPLPPAPDKSKTIKIPILMYHHIGDYPTKASATRIDLTVFTQDFETQVKWLKDNGYTSIQLKNLYAYSLGKFILPKKPVIFTFDDGYQDVFTNAVPILKKYGFIGSFAIITQYPHQQQGDNFYASWQDIAAASQAGNEIVSHTQNHFDGKDKKYSSDFITKNLTGSITDIQNHLGFTTNILIYPYGHYTQNYIDLAKKAGFVMGVTIHEGYKINLNDLMQIPRVRVHNREDLQKFIKNING